MFRDSVVQVVLVAALVAVAAAVVLASLRRRRPGAAAPGDRGGRAPDRGGRLRVAHATAHRAGGDRQPGGLVQPDGSCARGAGAHAPRVHRQRGPRAAHAAHEPKGYLEALRDGVIPPDRATFESLGEEAERLVRLSRGLDTLRRATRPGRSTAWSWISSDRPRCLRPGRPVAARRRASSITGRPARRHCPARGNPDQLAQVLGNLLQNAVRYTPRGGMVASRRSGGLPTSWSRSATPGSHPARTTCLTCSSASTASRSRGTGTRRRRHRARDRAPARRGGRWPRRRGVDRGEPRGSGSASGMTPQRDAGRRSLSAGERTRG